MNVSRDDAARALQDIGETKDRVRSWRAYTNSAPYLMIWGAAWVCANCAMDLLPASRPWAWPIADVIGIVLSILVGLQQNRSHVGNPESRRFARQMGRRFTFTFLAVLGFFVAACAIFAPLNPREVNTFISLFWALAYTIAGVWIGWRLAAIGLLLGALILFGYFVLQTHFYLWMGVIVGGALFFSGLWLRKA